MIKCDCCKDKAEVFSQHKQTGEIYAECAKHDQMSRQEEIYYTQFVILPEQRYLELLLTQAL